MEEWKEYKLGEIATSIKDRIDTSELDVKSYISTENMLPNKAGITLSSGVPAGNAIKFLCDDILISNIRPYFKKIWKASFNGGCSGDVICFRASDKVLPNYLYFLLSQDTFFDYVMKGSKGTKMPRGDRKHIDNWAILLPSKDCQHKIASILSSLDDKIENNRRINENLEQQAQALFKSWFVDFEPFRDQPFVESELGMIPQGWEVCHLTQISNIISGYSYKGAELKSSDTAMATIKNFDRSGYFKIDGFKEIVPSKKVKEEQFVKLFDVIVAHTDLTQNADIIGNPALILSFGKFKNIVISMDLCKVVSTDNSISNPLLYCFLKDLRFKEHALGYTNGTTVLHLSKKALPAYSLILPKNRDILYDINKTINDIFSQISILTEESLYLSSIRDTLLPKLMSGEIKV